METTDLYCSGPRESEAVKCIWEQTFGQLHNGNDSFETVVAQILKSARTHLNRSGRHGHLSVFTRDAFRDRLSLISSTVKELNQGEKRPEAHLSRKEENYDPNKQICYYELFDRLLPEGRSRNDDKSRTSRGNTGWIFASSCPLILIGTFSQQAIKAQYLQDDDLFSVMLEEYGEPKSGCIISDLSAKDVDQGNTQYLGVPIFLEGAQSSKRITIGVLRYTAKLCMPFVDKNDLCFLADVATIISAAIRHFKLLLHISRENKLDAMASRFRQTGNYHDFLKFVAVSLSSNIASLYVSIKDGERVLLRLVDACGISARVHDLRDQRTLKDYHTGKKGITWDLFKSAHDEPRVYDVPSDKNWRGLNMLAFYEKVFKERGINIADLNSKKLGEQVKRYSIRLMGCNLKEDQTSQAVGVFKVEFPSGYDEDESYNNEADRTFMNRCRDVLAPEVALLKSFVEEDWFDETKDDDYCGEFAKLLSTVITLKLIDQNEKPEFWAAVGLFIKKFPKVRVMIRRSVLEKLHIGKGKSQEIAELLEKLASWLPEVVGKILLEEGIKGGLGF